MATRKKWTKEEDEYLMHCMYTYSMTNSQLFTILEVKMDRTYSSIASRWYKLKKAAYIEYKNNITLLAESELNKNKKMSFFEMIKYIFKPYKR